MYIQLYAPPPSFPLIEVCSEDTGPAGLSAEAGGEGVREAEGVHGQPGAVP